MGLPVNRWFGLDYIALKALVQAMLLLLAVGMYYTWARIGRLPPSWAAARLPVIFGLSGLVFVLKESVVSDATYLFCAGAALVAISWSYRREWDRWRTVLSGTMIVILVFLSYDTRAIGLALPLAFAAFELWPARRVRL